MPGCRDESRLSTDFGATFMLSRLEEGGGDTGRVLFWSLLGPVFRSLGPLSTYGRVWLDLGVPGSVGVRGAGDKLSRR